MNAPCHVRCGVASEADLMPKKDSLVALDEALYRSIITMDERKHYGTSDHPMTRSEMRSLDGAASSGEDADATHGQYADNVTALPKREQPPQPDFLVGPLGSYHVVVDGRVMPLLSGFREGDKYWLVVDRRFACGPFGEEEARQAARLAGQAMAVTAGYPHLGAESKQHPFAPIGSAIDTPLPA